MNNQQARQIIIFFILAISGFISCSVWADCSFRNGTTTAYYHMSIPAQHLNQHQAPDTVLWDSGIVEASPPADIVCATDQVVYSGYMSAKTKIAGLSTPEVYKTNIPGIGIQVANSHDAVNLIYMRWPRPEEQAKQGYGYKQHNYFRVKLIATGETIVSGTLDLTSFYVDRTFGSARQFLLEYDPAKINVQAVGCDLDTQDITVPLTTGRGTVITSLSTSGDTTTPARFDINLTCQKTTNVSIKFNGTTVNGKNNILQLDNLSNQSSAQGVGVQVPHNGQPIDFDKEYDLLSNVTTTQVTLPYQARLIRLDNAIKAGDVNATATFDMIYR